MKRKNKQKNINDKHGTDNYRLNEKRIVVCQYRTPLDKNVDMEQLSFIPTYNFPSLNI